MMKLLKYLTIGLAVTTVSLGAQVISTPLVHVQATAAVPTLDLGVSLGNPSNEGSFVQTTVKLNQLNVRDAVIEELRKLREEMWDINPAYDGKTLQEVAKSSGLTTKEQYATAIKWDQTLEKKAIQRAIEAGIIDDHMRLDLSQYDIGFENLAWGYSDKGAVYDGWGYSELNDLQSAKGNFNNKNGHLHTQLNPRLRSFAVAHVEGVTAGAYSWSESQQLYGTNFAGSYTINLKVANELEEVDGQLGYHGQTYYRPDVTGLIKHTDGQTYYVEKGNVKKEFTGMVDALKSNGVSSDGIYKLQQVKAFIRNGKLDNSLSGLVPVDNKKLYYFNNGFVDATYTGNVQYNGLAYHVKNGVGTLTQSQSTFSNMYRLYNPNTKRHFYTVHPSEVKLLQSRGWILEGVSWINSVSASGTAVYRVYNKQTGERIFTRILSELEKFKARGWINEGIAFRMPNDGQKIYRLVNKQTKQYVLSAKLDEIQKMVASGQWINEGVAFFAVFP